MTGTRTVIRGGLVITAAEETRADVLIEDGRIAALAAQGSAYGESWTADRTIDATGRYVIPGGVDAHTHMELPFGGTFASDTFETGTRAAAWGGTTTIVDFAVQSQGQALRAGLDAWYAKADGNCAIDYAFHMIVSDIDEGSLKEMDLLVSEGITSFKNHVGGADQGFSTDRSAGPDDMMPDSRSRGEGDAYSPDRQPGRDGVRPDTGAGRCER